MVLDTLKYWYFFILLLPLSSRVFAGENLLPNGNFDAGENAALYWETVDNLTSFWVTEKGRGRVLKLDSRVDRHQALARRAELKTNPAARPPAAIIPQQPLKSIGANEGAVLDSDLIAVVPGQSYTLSVDIKGHCGIIVWIKGFMPHPRRKQLTDCYQTRLNVKDGSPNAWKTYSMTFNPTRHMPRTSKMKVRIFVYWPVGVACFDRVQITKISASAPPSAPR
ncbi:MAG: hypothetical protein PHH77_00800 [Victivallaceae bacterium]|nr:hypothetical protein [Victivallaceae bacterium]